MIDAAPHIMARLRPLLDNGGTHSEPGKWSHRPIYLPDNRAAARDLVWIRTRYPLEADPDLAARFEAAAEEYDSITAAVASVSADASVRLSPDALPLSLPLRPHQAIFRNTVPQVGGRILLADTMGLGKTVSGMSLLCEPDRRPALIVAPTSIVGQWIGELKRFLPGASTHEIKGHKLYKLPGVDVYVTAYSRLVAWQDVLLGPDHKFKTVIFDEVQDLCHTGTQKRAVARLLSERADVCAGLSGTPIVNYGAEIWSVIDVISPDVLGEEHDFSFEWCSEQKVREPSVLNAYLKSRGLLLRREPEDVGLDFGKMSKHVYTIDADLETMNAFKDVAKTLAITLLGGSVGGEEGENWDKAARDFDWRLRQATGVAKARSAAEFVRLLCQQGEKVVLAGWHREVYDIWKKELAAFKPVMITGSETPAQKQRAKQNFMEDENCKVLIVSLRTVAGLDGLQKVCNLGVFGELDWSPQRMDQVAYRLFRDGQMKHVQWYYLLIQDGSDPFISSLLNLKRSQHEGVIEGRDAQAQLAPDVLDGATDFDRDRVRKMAMAYLQAQGETIPEAVPEDGLLGEVAAGLRRISVPVNSEDEMQRGLAAVTVDLWVGAKVYREVRVGKRNRLDFLVTRDAERVGIECKVTSRDRQAVYRQVRRYVQEAGVTSMVIFAPWGGIPSFKVDGVPVIVVDYSKASLGR